MKSLKFESLRASSLKVGANLEFESLNGNPAWKFEAAATRVARGSKAKDRWRTRRGSQSSPQARVRKFESLEFESLKPGEFESSKASSLKVPTISSFGGLKVDILKLRKFERRGVPMLEIFKV